MEEPIRLAPSEPSDRPAAPFAAVPVSVMVEPLIVAGPLTSENATVRPLVAVALLPAMFFAAALPISFQGIGPSQAAAVMFFSKYTDAGETGVLARSPGEWTDAIVRLAEDVECRHRLGAAARAKFNAEYSVAAWGKRFVAAIES